jgi:hypothetical protein
MIAICEVNCVNACKNPTIFSFVAELGKNFCKNFW